MEVLPAIKRHFRNKGKVPAEITVTDQEAAPLPMTLIEQAVAGGADIEKLERLFDLQERWEKQQAKKAFYLALSSFQAQIPVIVKTKTVDFPNKSGGRTTYDYAPLDSIIAQTKDSFADNGLSYRWEFRDEDGLIHCSCTLTHVDGHSETSAMSAAPDDSGKKNAIQSIASARQYLQRYTIIGVAGLTTAEQDNDGRTPENHEKPPRAKMTPEDAVEKAAKLQITGDLAYILNIKRSNLGEADKREMKEKLTEVAKGLGFDNIGSIANLAGDELDAISNALANEVNFIQEEHSLESGNGTDPELPF